MKYTKHHCLVIVTIIILTITPLIGQDVTTRLNNIEQRLDQLEAQLDNLIAALRGEETLIPANVVRDSTHIYYGIISTTGTTLDKEYFVINHDDAYKIPYWVAYYLSVSNLQGDQDRTNDYRRDLELLVGRRSELKDYAYSGYNRGHMAPAAVFKRSREAMSASYLLSNMSPQRPELNGSIRKVLEDQVRQMVNEKGEGVFDRIL